MPEQRQLSDRGHLERNMIELALILTVQQVDSERKTFSRDIGQSDETFHATRIQCIAQNGHVVPHGSDNDVYAALTSLFVEQGMPESGIVMSTAYGIVTLSGLADSTNSYRTLEDCLNRLRNASYTIDETWHDDSLDMDVSKSFNLLASVTSVNRRTSPEDFKSVRAKTVLRIQLPDAIVQSIRGGYVRTYDIELYQKLKNVLGRGLYRLLDNMRSPGQISLTLPLIAWGEYLGYETLTASKIKSRLQLAHDELLRAGYLRGVEYTGRGGKMHVEYIFNPEVQPAPRSDIVAQLTQRGFTLVRARQLASQYGAASIEDATARFEYAKQRGATIKSAPAIMMDILKSPDKYPRSEKINADKKAGAKSKRKVLEIEENTSIGRTEKQVNILLMGMFDTTPERRILKERITELFISETIGVSQIHQLVSASFEDAVNLLEDWHKSN